jgi:NADPH-dependent 2,4-dienoyl-CoA reductase/sulfur reductase-like enzyme
MAEEVLIIGNGVAGATAALTLRARSDARVTLLSAEAPYFFSRTALMYALMDRMSRRDLEPFERASWSARGIARVQGRAKDLDADARTVTLDDGQVLRWDKLLLATGSSPRRLPVEGADRAAGVVGFVSMQDLDACERWVPSTREAVVIGGGLIGVELVECLLHHGVKTTFLVREPWYWPAALCEEEGAMIAAHLRAHGVDLRLGAEAQRIEVDADGRCAGVVLRDGEVIPAQLVGACIGVEPAVHWLRGVTTPPAVARGDSRRRDPARVAARGVVRGGLRGVRRAGRRHAGRDHLVRGEAPGRPRRREHERQTPCVPRPDLLQQREILRD